MVLMSFSARMAGVHPETMFVIVTMIVGTRVMRNTVSVSTQTKITEALPLSSYFLIDFHLSLADSDSSV